MDQTGGRVLGSLRNKTNAECCAACIANNDCDVWITGEKETPVCRASISPILCLLLHQGIRVF